MSQLANRAPGMVGAALEDDSTWAGIIVDGHHLHPATVRVAVRAKRADRLMLVTDAMPSVGPDAATFELQGRTIRREGDILRGADRVLAGSPLTKAGAVANMIPPSRLPLPPPGPNASAHPPALPRPSHPP